MADGLGTGDNTRAAVITRGLAEISRLGEAMGGEPATFAGLAGMGDLIATCISAQSRNRYVGEQLGKGRDDRRDHRGDAHGGRGREDLEGGHELAGRTGGRHAHRRAGLRRRATRVVRPRRPIAGCSPATPATSTARSSVADERRGPTTMQLDGAVDGTRGWVRPTGFDPERGAPVGWTRIGTLDGDAEPVVDERGAVQAAPGLPVIDWWVAGDDRWYFPSRRRPCDSRS